MAPRFVFLLLGFAAFAQGAETAFRIVHPDGTVEFTDEPRQGAEEVPLRQAPTAAPRLPRLNSSAALREREVGRYEQLHIITPVQDAVIDRHDGPHTVAVQSQPPLDTRSGHRFRFELDGQLLGTTTDPRFPLGDIYRGSHTVSAAIVDEDGRVLAQATPVTFHVRQHSRLLP